MVKVITYGTYDLLHYGHIRLLQRAKALGDYLIVGVTADDFDKTRGKINVQQSLMERIEAVRATGIADEIIVEEYEGQKIDDIKRYDIDIFTVGSDWKGQFDYLSEYCKVVYLDRTQGVSSSDLRAKEWSIRMGFVGETMVFRKYFAESAYVNGIHTACIYSDDPRVRVEYRRNGVDVAENFTELLQKVDAVYIVSHPTKHYEQVKQALEAGKHVLCESPIAITAAQCHELFMLACTRGLGLMDAIKTAYATAYNRLLLLLKSGKIGRILSVEATCTSLHDRQNEKDRFEQTWNSICCWGPTAMLPVFQILGTEPTALHLASMYLNGKSPFDLFTRGELVYPDAVASFKVGKGVKSEGELTISGTDGYLYVPAPWWKTDYFEIRYENPQDNKRYFYQLDGEGIRYTLVTFLRSIETGKHDSYVDEAVSEKIADVVDRCMTQRNVTVLNALPEK